MVKCYMTGVELPIDDAYLIDLGAAYRLLQQLRHHAAAVERLIAQLGSRDEVEVYDPVKKKKVVQMHQRLVSHAVSKVLGEIYPEKPLFIKWTDWKVRRAATKQPAAGSQISCDQMDGGGRFDDATAVEEHRGMKDDSAA
jgi:hypothetical protein